MKLIKSYTSKSGSDSLKFSRRILEYALYVFRSKLPEDIRNTASLVRMVTKNGNESVEYESLDDFLESIDGADSYNLLYIENASALSIDIDNHMTIVQIDLDNRDSVLDVDRALEANLDLSAYDVNTRWTLVKSATTDSPQVNATPITPTETVSTPETEATTLRLPQQASPIIFIGHGHSGQWRDLKDHLQDHQGLQVEAYESRQRAGFTTQEVLESMLDKCNFALLVLTGEDIDAEGEAHARENVIHELGLFQGRLGFRRAIVLLEEGCTEPSNIFGLNHIRFTKGTIREAFGDVMAALRGANIESAD
jgi:predicted nucleotide-binding protein